MPKIILNIIFRMILKIIFRMGKDRLVQTVAENYFRADGDRFLGHALGLSRNFHKIPQVFKVEFLWVPLTESTQIFLCDSVCVLGAIRIL